jgi:hypothetical protein
MFPGHNFPELELGWLRKEESVGEKGSAEGGVDSEEQGENIVCGRGDSIDADEGGVDSEGQEENIVCGSGDSIDEVVVVGEFGMTIAF